ncbi:NEW3 domain-containing protein [Micromonospora yasonensis]|uniref:glycoside hydrolase family 2 protein n=1 Tax=Micromonospora yasonensis TaxID=1128667 RepID=UPI00222F7A0E|nr:glycoside hydrolase family 2 TIM barrel-domain containing protein [Micromonospora yasonensis]MCW3840687.1 NEW3 domain-containing protein [Micromonospora yasonensis]
MARRGFLRATALGALTVAGWGYLGGGRADAATGTGGSSGAAQGSAARTMSLNFGWLFGLSSEGSAQPSFDDRGFAPVNVPHCVAPLGWRQWDYTKWQKVWTYRRHFDAPANSGQMRTFVDFAGALTTARPTFNGHALPAHQGGYLPFSYELTDLLTDRDNVLAVDLDATWQNVPPDGNDGGAPTVDYFEPGGLYRNVSLRMVPQVFIADVFAKPMDVLVPASRRVEVECTVDAAFGLPGPAQLDVVLSYRGTQVGSVSAPVQISQSGQVTANLTLGGLTDVQLWDPDHPNLYDVVVTLRIGGQPVHDFARRIGFREARFRTDGFFLNGNRLKLFGLNRHQVYAYGGMSMPDRVQRQDALILKHDFNVNMVRCSHYPQAAAFLDACDELGIMVWEETPGWGYLPDDEAFQELVVQNVHDMVIRDRNRPSIIIWAPQVNESDRNPELYTRTKNLTYALDGTRQTSGSSTSRSLTNWVQDVLSYDDYGNSRGNATISAPPAGIPYLVSESVGALAGPPGYRRFDTQAVQAAQARLHAQVHNTARSRNGYTGLLGWCGFDYDSLAGNTFQSMKWPGVADTFRIPKPGAAFYQSQVSPDVRPVIQPSFYWDFGPTSPVTSLGTAATIWSNCDRLEAYLDGTHYATLTPDAAGFPYLAYPPFYLDTTGIDGSAKPELRLDGYVAGNLVLSRNFAGDPAGDRLLVWADDTELVADGSDGTRVGFRAVDKYGAPRPYADGLVTLDVVGPGAYVGEVVTLEVKSTPELVRPGEQATVTATVTNAAFPFGDNGGAGAVYVRTLAGLPGEITVRASHPTLGVGSVRITAASPQGEVHPNPGGLPSQVLENTELSLRTPDGWTVEELAGRVSSDVAPGFSATRQWRVTAPAAVTPAAPTTLTAQAAYAIRGQASATQMTAPVYLATTAPEAYDNAGISADANPSAADFDNNGNSYSREALAAVGLAPGATVTHDGVTFTWPDTEPGRPDNMLALGNTVAVSGRGSTLGFLAASSYGTGVARGKVLYTDGTSTKFSFMIDRNTFAPMPGTDLIATTAYYNSDNGVKKNPMYVFYQSVPIDSGKEVAAVALIDGCIVAPNGRIRGVHVFAIGVGG